MKKDILAIANDQTLSVEVRLMTAVDVLAVHTTDLRKLMESMYKSGYGENGIMQRELAKRWAVTARRVQSAMKARSVQFKADKPELSNACLFCADTLYRMIDEVLKASEKHEGLFVAQLDRSMADVQRVVVALQPKTAEPKAPKAKKQAEPVAVTQ